MATKARDPKAAGIYIRISRDATGEGLGPRRQEEDCRALAKKLGFTEVVVYSENEDQEGTRKRYASATKGTRPEYSRLLADVDSRKVDAVIAWHHDRLIRHPAELETFITLVEQRGTAVAMVEGGAYDLSTPEGRVQARIIGAFARYEIEHKERRTKRENQQRAERGKAWVGKNRCYGYTHSTDPEPISNETAFITDAVTRVLAGESLRSVCNALNNAGSLTTRGNPWTASSLRGLLLNPMLTGTRVIWERNEKGTKVGIRDEYEGAWTPIITREQQRDVAAILGAANRKTRATSNARVALLPGFLFCGRCHEGHEYEIKNGPRKGAKIAIPKGTLSRMSTAGTVKKRRRRAAAANPDLPDTFVETYYQCSTERGGCGLTISRDRADEVARDRCIFLLCWPDQLAVVEPPRDESAREIADLEQRLAVFRDEFMAGTLSEREYRRQRDVVQERIDAHQQRFAEAGMSLVLSNLPREEGALREAWDNGSLEWRRAILSALVERFYVDPPVKAGRASKAEDRMRFESAEREPTPEAVAAWEAWGDRFKSSSQSGSGPTGA
jgi:site-specific DNA recombinase